VTLQCINTDALLGETASDAKDPDGNVVVDYQVANMRFVSADPRSIENPPSSLTSRWVSFLVRFWFRPQDQHAQTAGN
jgi:hypothetical protein